MKSHSIPLITYSRTRFQPSPKVYADIYIDDRNLGGLPMEGDKIGLEWNFRSHQRYSMVAWTMGIRGGMKTSSTLHRQTAFHSPSYSMVHATIELPLMTPKIPFQFNLSPSSEDLPSYGHRYRCPHKLLVKAETLVLDIVINGIEWDFISN